MDLKGFLKENNGFPENRRVHISPCFRENGEEAVSYTHLTLPTT